MTSLKFRAAYKLTVTNNGFQNTFVALGVRQQDVVLPDGTKGVSLQYRVNNPERFEHRFEGTVEYDDKLGTVEVQRTQDPLLEEADVYRFEPLTLETWKTLNVLGADEMVKELPDDSALVNFYWMDWVPDSWTEEGVAY